MPLYLDIAHKIRHQIEQGIYPFASRLPGVRLLSQQFGVSISTIVQAEHVLENSGLIEARPRSGFYVKQLPWLKPKPPLTSQLELKPSPVSGQELVLQLAHLSNQPDFVPLGAAVPDSSFLPMRSFQRSLLKVSRHYDAQAASYCFPPGLPALQQQIAKHMHFCGSQVAEPNILITSGCQEALSIALRSVTQAGDIIAIESPTFYGLLQVIESLGLKALEIPTDAHTGLSLSALELALEQWPIKACVLSPNFSNPLGCLMPNEHKAALIKLARLYRIALIEDDVLGDLSFNGVRPKSLHSFADEQLDTVIYCSSFSKTIAHGLRIGWMIVPHKLYQKIEHIKYATNLASPTLSQLALAEFLTRGNYERHLRSIRSKYAQQVQLFTQAIHHYFPSETRVSHPQGGFVIWVELNNKVDSLQLSHECLDHKISIAPGQVFSATQKYKNCLRLNCAQPWSPIIEQALNQIAKRLNKQLNKK